MNMIIRSSRMQFSVLILVYVLLTSFLLSCGDSFEMEGIARFKDSQPQGERGLSSFPSKIKGTYVSQDNSSTITVSNYNVNRIYDYWSVINKNELDRNLVIKADTLYDRISQTTYPVIVKADSIYLHHYSNDLVFRIDDTHVIKQFRGHYFLNTRRKEDGFWTVQKLTREGDKLILSIIASNENVNKLGEVTHTNIDTNSIQDFEPNKKEFKKFIKEDGFSEWEVFRKVK